MSLMCQPGGTERVTDGSSEKQSEKMTQDITDKYIKEIDKVTEEKEKEIMEI